MQSLQHEQWDEHGCFVYQVLRRTSLCEVLYTDETNYKNAFDIFNPEDQVFEAGDLVAVDMVRPSRLSKSVIGSALRLSDFSGWLFESIRSEQILKRLPVEKGLWSFYIDNGQDSIALKNHPYRASSDVYPSVTYQSMQMIYCDRCVISSRDYRAYRVQGTDGWVFDKNRSGQSILTSASFIRKGLFVYEVMNQVSVVRLPDSEGDVTPMAVEKNDIICCDVIRECPQSSGSGPFVRLIDGSGWLYVRKMNDSKIFLKRIPMESGTWDVKVRNEMKSVLLRRHPIDRNDAKICYPHHRYVSSDVVRCDKKVVASSGVCYYRVKGCFGWLFDRRGKKVILDVEDTNLIYAHQQKQRVLSASWSIDFIRGVASASDLIEIDHDSQQRVLSFQKSDSYRINVYYTTKMIGTTNVSPVQGKCQLLRRQCTQDELVQILRYPDFGTDNMNRTSLSYYEENAPDSNSNGTEISIDKEQSIRESLLETDQQINNLRMRMRMLSRVIKEYENIRSNRAEEMKRAVLMREKEYDEWNRGDGQNFSQNSGNITVKVENYEVDANKELNHSFKFTCDVCSRIFKDKSALDQHVRDFHLNQDQRCDDTKRNQQQDSWHCEECSRNFRSDLARDQHIRDCHRDLDHLFKCDGCCRMFKNKAARDQHFRDFHHKQDNDLKRKRALDFTCIECFRVFKDIHSLDQHRRDFHNKEDQLEELKAKTSEVNNFICLECSRIFASEPARVQHYRICHSKQGEKEEKPIRKRFVCLECSRNFKNEQALDQHLRDFHKSKT